VNEKASRSLGASVALKMIGFYRRWVSPLTPPSCRFMPSCSHYTYEAIERWGLLRGGWLGAKRICRCNPWHSGGFDPVPVPEEGVEPQSAVDGA
jgi:putative membrane protein insertion efficiency factor